MTNSTLGFIYTPDFQKVLLITKHSPERHRGKLNGLGGKSEPGESGEECISREVSEEAGLNIPVQSWKKIGNLIWEEWQVEIYATVFSGSENNVQSLTEDEVAWYEVDHLPNNVITNLRWLIPLGIDCWTNEQVIQVDVKYQ
jgi:8-oxo-dGTP diphosphatase